MPAAIARAAQPAVLFGFEAGACVVVAGALVVVGAVVGSDVVVGALGV